MLSPIVVVPIGILNQAILARRYYEANRNIVAPRMSQLDLTQLEADFSAIETRDQYQSVMNHLDQIAKGNHISLHKVNQKHLFFWGIFY